MAQRKDETPSVATYADHEVITPPHELRRAVAPPGESDDDPVARAEAALAELSTEFSDGCDPNANVSKRRARRSSTRASPSNPRRAVPRRP